MFRNRWLSGVIHGISRTCHRRLAVLVCVDAVAVTASRKDGPVLRIPRPSLSPAAWLRGVPPSRSLPAAGVVAQGLAPRSRRARGLTYPDALLARSLRHARRRPPDEDG